MIERKDVNIDHLSHLAGIIFSKEEKERCEKELYDFIRYSEIINNAIINSEKTDQGLQDISTPFREDEEFSFSAIDQLLANGPYIDEKSYIVPPQKKRKGKEKKVFGDLKNDTSSRSDYESVIGLEIHAQLKTKSKLFCSCSAGFGAAPNEHTCPVCSGQPGALPVLNKEAVKMAVLAGHSLKCKINEESIFARKNYFYPDLPKGYQISQFDRPVCGEGFLIIETNGMKRRVRINRIHMEEDAGKLVHVGAPGIWGAKASAVDFNRSSVPLIEIVSEPDLRSAEEAKEFVIMLRAILVNLGICDGNLEEGSLRCDANISLRKKGEEKLGVKTELKNINSYKAIERAIEYEIERQYKLLVSGIPVEQETRLWDESSQKTFIMRSKEESHDYKYFPDPDLIKLKVDLKEMEDMKKNLPLEPIQRKEMYLQKFQLSEDQARFLMIHPEYSAFFDPVLNHFDDKKIAANWFFNKLMSHIKNAQEIPFHSEDFIQFLEKVRDGKLNDRIGSEILKQSFIENRNIIDIIQENDYSQIRDKELINQLVDEIMEEYREQVEKYHQGKHKLLSFFIGELMKRTKGQADPRISHEIILLKLKNLKNGNNC